jgi:hypothetical protein
MVRREFGAVYSLMRKRMNSMYERVRIEHFCANSASD